jgi:hypothetical protein
MADTRALESIAELLPDDKRERFLANVVKFRNVPENDGQLQLLEAAGFIMLVMREIPRELDALLGRMRHGLSDEQRLAIRGDMEEILEGSIDAPSFEALRQLAADMRSSQSSFETAAATLTKKLRRTRHDYARHLAIGLAGGIVAGVFVAAATLAVGSELLREMERESVELAPISAMAEEGLIDYFEEDVEKYGGRVGIVVYSGRGHSAYEDAGMGLIVTDPIESELR